MARDESILRSLMGRGKRLVGNIEEPWWSKRYGDILGAVPGVLETFKDRKKEKQQEYGQELLTQQRFDSRLNLPILSAGSDGTLYTNKGIDELESRLTSIKNEDIKRFPDQAIDFIDVYDTKIDKLKEYRSLNNKYNYYTSKIPETEKFLVDITEKLSKLNWDDLGADKKLELKEELYKGTQEISEFKKFMNNNADYFSNNKDFSSDSDKVNINLIGGYNQLLKQINTFDPEGTIISEDEQRMMIQSLRDGNPDEIRARNETIATAANSRQKGYQDQFTNAYNEYTTTNLIINSPDYKKEEARIWSEFKKFDDDLKLKLENGKISQSEKEKKIREYAEEPMNWTTMPFGEKQTTYNIKEQDIRLISLEQMMDEADANFEKETGSKYSEWMGKRTPWRDVQGETFTPTFTGDVGDSLTEEEHEHLQFLQKDIEPEISGDTAEIYNPGNLRFADQKEAIGKDERGFAVFPSEEKGWDALYRQIELDKGRDLTLDKFINKYAPPSENDTTAYLKSLQKQLNTGKNTNINKIDTKELAVAIAKQEGYGGTFPEIEGDPPPKTKDKDVDIGKSLYKTEDGKTIMPSTSKPFIKAQSDLSSIASDRFSKLSASEKNKYKGSKKEATRQFVKDEFEKWLRKSGKYGKPYGEGDFVYFMPTKDKNNHRVWYPGAFKSPSLGAKATTLSPLKYAKERIELLYNPDVVALDAAYPKFAKDFDAFRKFLQES